MHRHTVRFLALWLFMLPLGLYQQVTGWNHYLLVPIMYVLGSFLLGIEELSTQMEEPFSILPMEKMCETSIRVPVMEQVRRSMAGLQAKHHGYANDGVSDFTSVTSSSIPASGAIHP